MPDNCIHDMPRTSCAHCSGDIDLDELDSDQNFVWQLLGSEGQQLTISWLDGQNVPFNRKFTFGMDGASLMIDCVVEITAFVASLNPAALFNGAVIRVVRDDSIVVVRTFPDFTLENGLTIHKPYIQLERGGGNWRFRIAFGRVKAKGFLHYQSAVRAWMSGR